MRGPGRCRKEFLSIWGCPPQVWAFSGLYSRFQLSSWGRGPCHLCGPFRPMGSLGSLTTGGKRFAFKDQKAALHALWSLSFFPPRPLKRNLGQSAGEGPWVQDMSEEKFWKPDILSCSSLKEKGLVFNPCVWINSQAFHTCTRIRKVSSIQN